MHTHKAQSHTKTQAQAHTQEDTRRQVHVKTTPASPHTYLTKYPAIAAGVISTTEHNTHALSHNHKHTYTRARTHWELTTKNE